MGAAQVLSLGGSQSAPHPQEGASSPALAPHLWSPCPKWGVWGPRSGPRKEGEQLSTSPGPLAALSAPAAPPDLSVSLPPRCPVPPQLPASLLSSLPVSVSAFPWSALRLFVLTGSS